MNDDGTCPRCGRLVDAPTEISAETSPGRSADGSIDPSADASRRGSGPAEDERTPWHFKLLVVALVVYLGWRFSDLVM